MSEILNSIDDRYEQLNIKLKSKEEECDKLYVEISRQWVLLATYKNKIEAFDEQTEVCKRLCEENNKLDIDLTYANKQYNQCMELIRNKDICILEKNRELSNHKEASGILSKTYKALKERYDKINKDPEQNYNKYIIIGSYLFIVFLYILHLNK